MYLCLGFPGTLVEHQYQWASNASLEYWTRWNQMTNSWWMFLFHYILEDVIILYLEMSDLGRCIPTPHSNGPRVTPGTQTSYTCYDNCGRNTGQISPCGPTICYTCPDPNDRRLWHWKENNPTEVDPVRHNIYYGGMICGFEPRESINKLMCDRMFLNSPARPPYEFAKTTDLEFQLWSGKNKGCSPFWNFRYEPRPPLRGTSGNYERAGPAVFERK